MEESIKKMWKRITLERYQKMRGPWKKKSWRRRRVWRKVCRRKSMTKKHQRQATRSRQCGRETLKDTTGLEFLEAKICQRGFQKTTCQRNTMCLYDGPSNLKHY